MLIDIYVMSFVFITLIIFLINYSGEKYSKYIFRQRHLLYSIFSYYYLTTIVFLAYVIEGFLRDHNFNEIIKCIFIPAFVWIFFKGIIGLNRILDNKINDYKKQI